MFVQFCDYVSEFTGQFQECRHHGVRRSNISLLPDDDRFPVVGVYFSDSDLLCIVRHRGSRVSVMIDHYVLCGREMCSPDGCHNMHSTLCNYL